MSSPKTYPTIDEAVSYLNKSSLPTVITEGKDDYLVFRRIEEDLRFLGVDVMPVGSRDAVLGIYARMKEIGKRPDLVYVADRDLWVFGDVPDAYMSDFVVFTDGYSIENDLFRDGPVLELMMGDERDLFNKEIKEFSKLYALEVSRSLSGNGGEVGLSPSEFFDQPGRSDDLLSLRPGEEFPHDLYETCVSEYARLLRGKSLLSLALRQLSSKRRIAKHSRNSLIEQAAVRRGPLVLGMTTRIQDAIGRGA